MKNTGNAAAPQGGSAAHQGRTGVECNNKSIYWGQALLNFGLVFMTGVAVFKVCEHLTELGRKDKKPKRHAVDIEAEETKKRTPVADAEVKVQLEEVPIAIVESEESIESRIRLLRSEGMTYPNIAKELHVSIRVISRVLKAEK